MYMHVYILYVLNGDHAKSPTSFLKLHVCKSESMNFQKGLTVHERKFTHKRYKMEIDVSLSFAALS